MKTIKELVAAYHAGMEEVVRTGRRFTPEERAGNILCLGDHDEGFCCGTSAKVRALRVSQFSRRLIGDALFEATPELVGAERIIQELPE